MIRFLLWPIVFLTVALTSYALFLREWIRVKRDTGVPWAVRWFSFWEPIEIYLWRKSETILFARLKIFVGTLLTFLTQMQYIDLSPVMPFFPEKHRPLAEFIFNCIPLVITVLGLMDEKLRRETTKPLDLVAIREEDVPPEVRAAIIAAEQAKKQAVQEVQTAKALGEIPK
jgi:hypothetical protein